MPNKKGMGKRSYLKIEKISTALSDGPLTTKDLCEKLFISETNAKFYLRYLRRQEIVRVARWTRTAGGYTPHYGLGIKDAQKPKPLTKHQRYIRYMTKIKQDDRYVNRLAREKAKKIKPHADEMLSWIPRRENSKESA